MGARAWVTMDDRPIVPVAVPPTEPAMPASTRGSDLVATNAELKAENDRLRERIAELESAGATGATERPKPQPASFGMCEGVRAELEQRGSTTDPFTGKVVTADGGVQDDDDPARVRQATPETTE